MQSDDDLQTTLSKWPFILGDVLLVATALAIAILGQWQLTNWQVASCVISVALGCGLFVLPYIVEFQVRVREEAEDRTADLRILQRHIVSAEEQLEAVAERIEPLEAGLANLAHAEQPDLTAPFQALEGKIDPLNHKQAEQSTQLEALAKQVDVLGKSLKSKSEVEAIQALQAELADLQARFEELPTQVVEAPQQEPPSETSEPKEAPSAEPIVKKTRAPRQRRTPEPRLLQRAIEQKQEKSSQAVSRIIESKSKKPPAVSEAPVEPIPGELKEETPEPLTEPVTEGSEETCAPEPEAVEPKTKEPEAEPTQPEPTKKAEPKPEPESVAEEAPKEAEPEPAESEDMFGDTVPVQEKKRSRTKKSDTAVIASVFIGIGNKPFVRGSGAGLNWDCGIAMEFEEIGKWRWIAPAEMEESVEIQLYRNDEDADSTGKYTLEPGQQLDLLPVF